MGSGLAQSFAEFWAFLAFGVIRLNTVMALLYKYAFFKFILFKLLIFN